MESRSIDVDLRREIEALLQAVDKRPRDRCGGDAIEDLQRLERCIAHLEAMRADLLVEAADPEPRVEEFTVESVDGDVRRTPRTIVIEDAVREEIAAALHWSPSHAGALIENARRLHAHLPETLDALRSGTISGRHASVLVEWSGRLSARDATGPDGPEIYARACAAFEERVLRVARRSTVAQTRAAAKRALAALDAEGVQLRRQQQRCMRDVSIIEEADGNSVLFARMSTPAARAVFEAVGREAKRIDHEPLATGEQSLSVGERRAQALTSLVLGAVAPQVRLDVVLPAMAEGRVGVGAIIDGFTSATIDGAEVGADDLRDLLADPAVEVTMRKLVADPVTGVLSGCGRTSYRLPERLREFIVRRDGMCRFPGCRRSARNSQIDHAHAWDDGGTTDPGNLGALCTRHHQLKTHAGWQLEDSRADGGCNWVSPQGRRYRHHPKSVVEVTLEQQFARVLASALSRRDHPGYPPGRPLGHPSGEGLTQEFIPASLSASNTLCDFDVFGDSGNANAAHRRDPDPPF